MDNEVYSDRANKAADMYFESICKEYPTAAKVMLMAFREIFVKGYAACEAEQKYGDISQHDVVSIPTLEKFSPTRYPYTYAYDYLSCYASKEEEFVGKRLPNRTGVADRSGCAQEIQQFAVRNHFNVEMVCKELARRYCQVVGIQIPITMEN